MATYIHILQHVLKHNSYIVDSQIINTMSSKNNKTARSIHRRPSWSLKLEPSSAEDINTYIRYFRNSHLLPDIPLSEEQEDIRLNILQDLCFLESIAGKQTLTDTEQRNLNVFLRNKTHYAHPIAEQIQIRLNVIQDDAFLNSIANKQRLSDKEQTTLDFILAKRAKCASIESDVASSSPKSTMSDD